jgi:predicted RNase H-like nuclease
MRYLGLDGFRHGWVAVWIDGEERYIEYFPNITDALSRAFDIAMVDMPIGLPDRGYRRCDIEGKKILGAAGSRVFLGARRTLFDFKSAPEANRWATTIDEKGISSQLWCLLKKLREVDSAMTAARQQAVMECHPELVFYRLNNSRPVSASKKKPEGIVERCRILKQYGFLDLDEWLRPRTRNPNNGRVPGAARDDVLDACACAIAAQDRSQRIPSEPELDARGLRMEIWF